MLLAESSECKHDFWISHTIRFVIACTCIILIYILMPEHVHCLTGEIWFVCTQCPFVECTQSKAIQSNALQLKCCVCIYMNESVQVHRLPIIRIQLLKKALPFFLNIQLDEFVHKIDHAISHVYIWSAFYSNAILNWLRHQLKHYS